MQDVSLITSLYVEGMYPSSFRVVEAESELEIAQHMLNHPSQWQWFLERSYPRDWQRPSWSRGSVWDCIQDPTMTPQRWLELIDMAGVDGDSYALLNSLFIKSMLSNSLLSILTLG
ncbi:hypothetical protein [Funiculus sociatus]|uniref:hypothetical protein n=1 Tax=Funiculus sociatus TaxID=450527 RepID=UPI003299B4AE